LQAQVRAEHVAEAAGHLGHPLVAELGRRLQVVLEPVEHDRQIHDDIIMTSHGCRVKHEVMSRFGRSGPDTRSGPPKRARSKQLRWRPAQYPGGASSTYVVVRRRPVT